MLYERWRQIAGSFPNELAIRDVSNDRDWTFGQLATKAESGSSETDKIAFPQGSSSDFVLTVLRAWRAGILVCPLEPGQIPPEKTHGLPSQVQHLKMTSASTGHPRLVAFTASQLFADAENIVSTMGLKPESPNIGVISLAHSYGFSNLILPLLLHGIPLILPKAAYPENVRRAASDFKELTLPAVPALWRTWDEARAIPPNVRLAISAGAPLPIALEHRIFANCGLKIHNFYGSSECGGIAYDATSEPREGDSCVGTALRNVQIDISDEGCVVVRGAAVAETYWPEPAPELGHGIFCTSDLGEILGNQLYLRGRATDQINVAGRKVSPEAIERILSSHPAVRECVIFGIPSPEIERGDTIIACLAVREQIDSDVLKQFLITRLPAWQVPREWQFLDSLEVNGRGKLSRAHWRHTYLLTVRENGSLNPGLKRRR